MDLGYKPDQPKPMETAAAEPESKVYYPSFSISGEAVDRFCKEHKIKRNDKFKATVELELTGWNDNKYEKRLEFEVHTLDVKEKAFEDKSSDEQFDELRNEAQETDAKSSDEGYAK